jgi:hypothetical protein
MSHARGTITGLCCVELSPFRIPSWLDQYIESIGKSPNLIDFSELNIAVVRHTNETVDRPNCGCASIPSRTIRDFWGALGSAVDSSFEKVSIVDVRSYGINLFTGRISSIPRAGSRGPRVQTNSSMSQPESYDVFDANFILRSSDLVDFRVHKSVLATVSPFFKDLLSLPQPSDSEMVDGLPVVQLSEDSELLNSLISILYPIHTVIPNSYEKVLHLFASFQH